MTTATTSWSVDNGDNIVAAASSYGSLHCRAAETGSQSRFCAPVERLLDGCPVLVYSPALCNIVLAKLQRCWDYLGVG